MSKGTNGTAWAFLVVSDPQQADTLADQEAWARDAARQGGWTITKVVSGVSSGKLGARGLTVKMIDELEALPAPQRPARLLMIRLERLGRGNGLEAMEGFLRIRRLGIVVHTRIDGDVSYERASDLLMPVLRFFIGGMENEVRRDKLLSLYARLREARKGDPWIAICMRPPYGLSYCGGKLVEKPAEAAAVRLAYELKLQGYGSYAIAKRLTAAAAPLVLKGGEQRPQKWNAERVRRLIIKPTYRATVVDEDTWIRAQAPIKDVSRPTIRYEYSLGGALRCECGYKLCGCRGTGKRTSPFRYYQCRNLDTHGHFKHHRSNLLEEQFLALIGRLALDEELLAAYLASESIDAKIEPLVAQLALYRSEHGRLDERRRSVFSAFEDETLSRVDLQWRLEDLRQRAVELEQLVEQLERELTIARATKLRTIDAKNIVALAQQNWAQAPIDDRRALAKALSQALGGLVVTLDGTLHVGVQTPARPRVGRSA